MKRYLFPPIAFLILFASSLGSFAAENATITGDGLRVRERPSTDGGIIGSLNKGTRVEVLAHTDATDSIDGFTGYWYYISYKLMKGYVFGKYIKADVGTPIPSEKDYRPNTPVPPAGGGAELADILGDWPTYFDAPNVIFSFYSDMTAKFVESTFVGGGERVVEYPPVWGTYTFDGKAIAVSWNDGTSSVFTVVKKRGGVTALYLGETVLPPELHMLGPGGYYGID